MGGEFFLVLLVAGVGVSLAFRIRLPFGLFVTVNTLSFWMVLVLFRVLGVEIGLIGEILFLLADSQHVKDEKSSDPSLRLAVLEERVDDRFRGFERERREEREDALSRQR